MSDKHSPWFFHQCANDKEYHFKVSRGKSIWPKDIGVRVRDESTATLIKAAVNSHAAMVEALRDTIKYIDKYNEILIGRGIRTSESISDFDNQFLSFARAALAAAEGGAK